MPLIEFCIRNPIKVTVGVLLTVLFGLISLFSTPVQLIPNVDQPIITIATNWTGASPQEVEEEIVDEQEAEVKSVTNLREMRSTSNLGRAEVELEFDVGVDRDAALVEVQNKLQQVGSYPEQVDEPRVTAADAGLDNPIAWLILMRTADAQNPEAGPPVPEIRDFVDDMVRPRLERVTGVASVNVFGGLEQEVQVRVDPYRLAARNLTVPQVVTAIENENVNRTAGRLFEGKREYVFRTVGQYESLDQIRSTVVAYAPNGGPIYVRDVADVQLGFKKPSTLVRNKGQSVLAMPVRRQFGTNVMEVMAELKTTIADLNKNVLAPRGLEIVQVYDETVYIEQSIALVTDALWQGALLTILVLVLFLRSAKSTLVTTISIPVACVATFIFVQATGRSLNVIMLAGIAFTIGMLVDNAIVVVENIFRHRQMGKDRFQAALDGSNEVWMAILASTTTTLVVFLPVIFVQEEAGQLFQDIAIAASAAVAISLVLAITVVPCLAARLVDPPANWISVGESADDVNSKAGGRLGQGLGWFLLRAQRMPAASLAIVGVLTSLSLWGAFALLPPASYLPTGNRNLIFGALITPPGYSIEEFVRIGEGIEARLSKYWNDDYKQAYLKWKDESGDVDDAEQYGLEVALVPVGPPPANPFAPPEHTEKIVVPYLERFFYVSRNGGAFMGAISGDDDMVRPLSHIMQEAIQVPGSRVFLSQASIFGRGIGGGSSVELVLSGENIDRVRDAANMMMRELRQAYGMTRPNPANFALGGPEQRLVPMRERTSEFGLNTDEVATIAAAALDGAYAGDYRFEGRTIDLVVQLAQTADLRTQGVPNTPIVTPRGGITTLDAVVEVKEISADQQIFRVEELPSVSLTVTPEAGEAIESLIEKIETQFVAPMRASGQLPPDIVVRLTGTADKFTEIKRAMLGEWTGWNPDSFFSLLTSRMFLAVLVVYLLMAGLYESWLYPLVILFSLPFGVIGGIVALNWLHDYTVWSPSVPIQQLDMLTMLGFVMLLGTAVNNAILVVYQSLAYIKAGLPADVAIATGTRTRLRPIGMTTITTCAGLAPLVFAPGAGSELYRGIGAVMLGGMFTSTLFTLIVVPLVFSLAFRLKYNMARLLGTHMRELPGEPIPGREPVPERKRKPEPTPPPTVAEATA